MTEFIPSPITSMNELLARLDMLLDAVNQCYSEDDIDIRLSIALRMQEVAECVHVVGGDQDEWVLASVKIRHIKAAVNRSKIGKLEDLNHRER